MKTVVITGASKGIGRAVAEKFASQGLAVALCARNAGELDNLASEIKSIYKTPVLQMVCDVADKNQLQAFADEVIRQYGTIDILVNNAGVFVPGQVSNEEDGVFEKLMATNTAAPYHLTRMLLPVIKRPGGHIFNICSTASITAYVNGGSYCISKFALYGMTKVLREELKPQVIKVTAVLPGATYTSSWKDANLPEERFIPATDVANAIWDAYNTAPSTVVEELLVRPLQGDIS